MAKKKKNNNRGATTRRKGKKLILRPIQTTADGKTLYASDYGLKAWAMWI